MILAGATQDDVSVVRRKATEMGLAGLLEGLPAADSRIGVPVRILRVSPQREPVEAAPQPQAAAD